MKYCNCMSVLSINQAIADLNDEVYEWLESHSLDEASDVCYAIGRLVAAYEGMVYASMLGDEGHIAKIDARMAEYGCIRSRRHLVDGECPSRAS